MPSSLQLEEDLASASSQIEKSIKSQLIMTGFTQAELAKMLGVGRPAISLAISGASNPQATALRKKIYKILGMN